MDQSVMLLGAEAMRKENNSKKNFTCWNYCIISENNYHIDIGKYHTYGIQVTELDCVRTLHDVHACKETVDWMVELFNCHQLSPIHLQDAVEDMLP